MIGLDRQFLDVPPKLVALRLDQCPAVGRDLAREDGFAPLRTPDEVVDDEVDPVFVSLIFHVDSISAIDSRLRPVARNQRAEALRRNPPNHGLKPRGLRRVQRSGAALRTK